MNTSTRRALAFSACFFLVSCSSGGGGGGGGGGSRSLSGTVTYDFVPAVYDPVSKAGTLDFAHAAQRPVRNGTVQVMKGTTVLATTTTDAAGHYALGFTESGTGQLAVVALAQTASPAIQVQDNTDGGAVWGIGANLDATATAKDLHATHGWTGTSFDPATRSAAPFAILDSMYTASKAFQAVRPAVYPALAVNWSPNNVPAPGDVALGDIGTSHFSSGNNQIYILGKDGVDTDEFDSHVIVHEWGHFFEHNLSRSDSPGGPHGPGDVLDPRLSFGEGYGNALAAMLLPESIYADTNWSGPGGTLTAFGFDAESEPAPTDDPAKSAFSEMSVMRLLYDLFDSGSNEAFDNVALGLGVIYDVLTGHEKTTQALTTIGSFVTGVKAQPGVNAAAVDALLAHYNIGPISDDFGTGDTLDAATGGLQAMYVHVAAFPVTTSIFLTGGFEPNKWQQNQYYWFMGNGAQVTVTAISTEDVAFRVYEGGQHILDVDDVNGGGTETVQGTTVNGAIYVLNLVGFSPTAADYQVTLHFTSP